MSNEGTELEKILKMEKGNKQIVGMLWQTKAAITLIGIGLGTFPLVMNYFRDADGYINIVRLLSIEGTLIGLPTLYMILKIIRM